MKTYLRWLLAVATAWSLPLSLPAASEALGRFDADYAQALCTGDSAVVASRLADDIRLMPEFQRSVEGREPVLAYYRALAGRFVVQDYRREPIGSVDLGSHVVATGRFAQKLARRSDGKEYELNGKYLDLWRKSPAGGLLLATQAWNYDRWFDAGDEFRFAEVPGFVAAQRGRAPLTNDVHLELAALGRLIGTVMIEHDAPLFARLYADDAVLLPNYDAACVGRPAIAAFAAAHFLQLPVFEQLDIRNDRIEVLDGYVLEYASHVASWRNGDASGVSTGKNLRIWRREPNHALKIVFQVSAYD